MKYETLKLSWNRVKRFLQILVENTSFTQFLQIPVGNTFCTRSLLLKTRRFLNCTHFVLILYWTIQEKTFWLLLELILQKCKIIFKLPHLPPIVLASFALNILPQGSFHLFFEWLLHKNTAICPNIHKFLEPPLERRMFCFENGTFQNAAHETSNQNKSRRERNDEKQQISRTFLRLKNHLCCHLWVLKWTTSGLLKAKKGPCPPLPIKILDTVKNIGKNLSFASSLVSAGVRRKKISTFQFY